MHQTKIAVTASDAHRTTINQFRTVSYGRYIIIWSSWRSWLYLGPEDEGVRLDLIVVAFCSFTMCASNSMNACADCLDNPAFGDSLECLPEMRSHSAR